MSEEYEKWFRQAEADLKSARNSLRSGDFYVSAFLAQQAAEKALKALMLNSQNQLIRTHSVVRMAKSLNAPHKMTERVSRLEPVYQETRYPDVSSRIPSEEYVKEDADEMIGAAAEVLEWVRKAMR